jgi:hypothetical protein
MVLVIGDSFDYVQLGVNQENVFAAIRDLMSRRNNFA